MPALVRRPAVALGAALLSALAVAPAASAEPPGARAPRPAVVVSPGCPVEQDHARAWTGPGGVEHVFYSVEGPVGTACGDAASGTTWYASRRPGGSWTRERTPFTGRLMAAAGDSTGGYVLYADGDGVHLTRRTPAGAYREVRRLSPLGLLTHVMPTGALVVRDGAWWAVWTENRTPDTFGTTDLWQARSMGTPMGRTRITDTPDQHENAPRLALRPGGQAFLAYQSTLDSPDALDTVHAGTSRDGRWALQAWDAPWPGGSPDVAVSSDGVTSVAWVRSGGTVMYADDRTGAFVPEPVLSRGFSPTLAVRGSRVSLGVTAISDTGPVWQPHLLRRTAAGGAWTREVLTPGEHRVLATTDSGSRTTVLLSDGARLLSRSVR